MCSQKLEDEWSLIWSCCSGLGVGGGGTGLLPTVGEPRPHGSRFGGEKNSEGYRCLKSPTSSLGEAVGRGHGPLGSGLLPGVLPGSRAGT